VGELSAVNAIAGAYSEYVPIVHIVGYPSTLSQKNGALLHHTLGNGDFTVFSRMSKEISCAVSMLNHQHEAAMLIDNAIRECILQSRPVYISLPSDMVQKKLDGDRLNTPLDLEYPPNDQEAEDYVVDVVLKYLHAAKNPVIVVDGCAIRHRALKETHELVKKSGIPTFVAPMGKGAVDETLPNYGGVYAGNGSNAGVKDRVESADLVLSIGAIQSDFNTAGFTVRMSQMNTIDFHSYARKAQYRSRTHTRQRDPQRRSAIFRSHHHTRLALAAPGSMAPKRRRHHYRDRHIQLRHLGDSLPTRRQRHLPSPLGLYRLRHRLMSRRRARRAGNGSQAHHPLHR
jgi:pyruvate decarboxylase